MTEQQAMRMALEALERSVATCFDQYAHEQVMSRPEHFVNQAITALLQALEQQSADDPVAWYRDEDGIRIYYESKCWDDATPLYTTPPQRKPLTEKRIEELYSFWVVDCQDIVGFARAVERTVKGEV